ncbi:MAG TPA: hypothetical protein VFL93_11230 [Longimicrobiaceae bacterium]|nr:hypothetical protein [Longimicrobiaceae bacterium]
MRSTSAGDERIVALASEAVPLLEQLRAASLQARTSLESGATEPVAAMMAMRARLTGELDAVLERLRAAAGLAAPRTPTALAALAAVHQAMQGVARADEALGPALARRRDDIARDLERVQASARAPRYASAAAAGQAIDLRR